MTRAQDEGYSRHCPDEEAIPISDAVCLGRRRANFHKCPGCPFNDDELGTPSFAASIVGRPPTSKVPLDGRRDTQFVDKVFKAYDVRAITPDPLSEDVAWRIGNATAQFLRTSLSGYDRSDTEMNKLIVGRDMRKSSPALTKAFIEGAVASGTSVVDIGMTDTPQVYFAANHLKCCGAVQVTASHNPANYNGFKISGPNGRPVGADTGLKEIARIAAAISHHRVDRLDIVQQLDLSNAYRDFLLRFLDKPRPMKVVIDASNGMAGRWFPIIFGDVPGLDIVALNYEHTGDFNHPPNPLVAANLEELRCAVQEHGADFGACFDGDADRCVFVDERARIVGGDLLTALLARDFLQRSPGSTIVYDLRSSRIVSETIREAGGTPKRQRVGHVFMKRAMRDANAVFGGELSGHFYFRDFWYCDSGMLAFIAVLNVLTRSGEALSTLLKPLYRYHSTGERNYINDDKEGTFKRIAEKHPDADIDFLDGVTVQYEDWWFNVRASNTEPLLRLNLEADTEETLTRRLAELVPLLGEPAVEL